MRGDWVMHVASNCDFPQVTVRLVVHYMSDSGWMAQSSIPVRRPERVNDNSLIPDETCCPCQRHGQQASSGVDELNHAFGMDSRLHRGWMNSIMPLV